MSLPLTTKFNPAKLAPDVLSNLQKGDALPSGKQFLLPGQLHVAIQPTTISTILGSCVAICLWDMKKRIGGMNHYLLPDGDASAANRLRYGNIANQELLQQMLAAGSDIKNLQARIFGGSSAFANGNEQTLGDRNIDLALDFVRRHGIPLLEKQVSGKRGRKLIFNTQDGTTQINNFED